MTASKRASQREAAMPKSSSPRPRLGPYFQTSLFTRVVIQPRDRAPISAARRISNASKHDSVFRSRAVAARSPGPRLEGLQRTHSNSGTGDSGRPRRARPHGHRADGDRQDGRLHAAQHRPLARCRPADAVQILSYAGARADARTGWADCPKRQGLRRTCRPQGAEHRRRYVGQQGPEQAASRHRYSRGDSRSAARPDRSEGFHARQGRSACPR